MKILKDIVKRHGYILSSDMQELEELVGDECKIVIKTVYGSRTICTIAQYYHDDKMHKWLDSNGGIKEVFISANVFNDLENAVKNNDSLDTIKIILR